MKDQHHDPASPCHRTHPGRLRARTRHSRRRDNRDCNPSEGPIQSLPRLGGLRINGSQPIFASPGRSATRRASGHAERLVHKLSPTRPADIKAQERCRTLIWNFYRDLKAYRDNPSPKRAKALRLRFDRVFTARTGYEPLDQLLVRLHGRKAELLKVLERPEVPIHTNGSENDIRAWVTKRNISGGTVSDIGKAARQATLGLAKTCAKLGISFYQFLGDRFDVPGAPSVPSLPALVRMAHA